MKDYRRALRRHTRRTRYIRRLRLLLSYYDQLRLGEGRVLYKPSVANVLGTEYEKPFMLLRNTTRPCSCPICKNERYKRYKSDARCEILNDINDEGCCDRVPWIR